MTNNIGDRILHFDTVGSTNDIAWSYAEESANHGLVVIAQEQTAGRGRRGSSWHAPHGSSILASILLFPPPELQRPVWLTLWSALAICETIASLLAIKPTLKWPNDVLLQGKKVAGVLIEQRNEVIVAGFGINLTIPQEFFEKNYYRATAIQHFATEPVRRDSVLNALLLHLNHSYAQLCQGDSSHLQQGWRHFSSLEGQQVLLTSGISTYAGRIRALCLHEIELQTKQGTCAFAPETVTRIQLQP